MKRERGRYKQFVSFVMLETNAEYPCKASNIGEAHDGLELLELVSGDENLITEREINVIQLLAFVNPRHVNNNLAHLAVRLATQHSDFAPVAGIQDATCFGYRFRHGHATVHQTNAWLEHVAKNAVAIRRRLFQDHSHLRIDDVLVVLFLDDACDFLRRFAVHENSTRNQHQRDAATWRHRDPFTRVAVLVEDFY